MICLLKLKLYNTGNNPDYFFQIHKYENIKETEKTFHIISERTRLPKNRLGEIIDKTRSNVFSYMTYTVYCYEKDIEKYKNLLLQTMANDIQDMVIAANNKLKYIQTNTPREIVRLEDD